MQATGSPIPTVVIGGYLGAGKTTLVNHLLRHAGGRRIAVLVNDFGELAIDADLIVGADGSVVSLAGGCVCCSFGDDLVGTLAEVARREPAPDVILIETSGVGLPAAVARSARLLQSIQVEGVVGVCDAVAIGEQARHRHVGDTVRQQLADADLLLLNKADLQDDATANTLRTWLRSLHPATPVVATVDCAVDPDLVLGLQALPRQAQLGRTPRWQRPPAPAADVFASRTEQFDAPVDVQALARQLTAPGSAVVRAKGLLCDLQGTVQILQVVGRRSEIRPAAEGFAPQALGRLLVIALRPGQP